MQRNKNNKTHHVDKRQMDRRGALTHKVLFASALTPKALILKKTFSCSCFNVTVMYNFSFQQSKLTLTRQAVDENIVNSTVCIFETRSVTVDCHTSGMSR